MAPTPKGVKRGNSSFKGAGAALKKSRSVFKEQGQAAGVVAKALKDAALPASVVSTLRTAASYCLCTPVEDRHPSEVAFVEMIGEALVNIEASLTADVDKFQGLVNGQDQEKSRRDAAIPLTATDLAAKKSQVATAEAGVEVANFNAAKSAAAFKMTLKAQKVADCKMSAISNSQAAIMTIHTNMIEPMRAAASSKKELAGLVKALFEYGIDLTPHVASQHIALCKEVGDRSEFDSAVLQNLEKEVSTKLAELNSALEGADAEKQRECVAATEKAKQADEDASSRREKAKEALHRATVAAKEAEKALTTAKVAIHTYVADMKKAVTDLASAEQKRSDFRDGPWASYVNLKDLKRPSPPRPDEPAEAAPAEAAPAKAAPAETPVDIAAV